MSQKNEIREPVGPICTLRLVGKHLGPFTVIVNRLRKHVLN